MSALQRFVAHSAAFEPAHADDDGSGAWVKAHGARLGISVREA